MGLTEPEQAAFVAGLQKRGWELKGDTIYSPSQGLWFSESHFRHWVLREFCEVFAGRAERIRRAVFKNWECNARENQDASDVARELLSENDTQPADKH